MGVMAFILYFIVALIGTIFWLDFATNKFVQAFVLALIIAMLGVRGNN